MFIGEMIEEVNADAVLADGSIGRVSSSVTYDQGKWLVLFFYPSDFTWVCPTELLDLDANFKEFQRLETEVWAISTDSVHAHKSWRLDKLGEFYRIPMVSDRNWEIGRQFDCLDEDQGLTYRCTVIIDPEEVIRHYSISDNAVGRCTGEILRLLAALKATDASDGCVACANWQSGDLLITPGE